MAVNQRKAHVAQIKEINAFILKQIEEVRRIQTKLEREGTPYTVNELTQSSSGTTCATCERFSSRRSPSLKGSRRRVRPTTTPRAPLPMHIEKTRKLAVSAAVIRKVAAVNLDDELNLRIARDLFMFSFYCRGMSFADLTFLRHEDIRDGV